MSSAGWSILLYPLIKQQTEGKDNWGYMCGMCVPAPVHESAWVISLVVFCALHVPHEWIRAHLLFVISCAFVRVKTFYHIRQWNEGGRWNMKKWRSVEKETTLVSQLAPCAGEGSESKATAREVFSVASVLWACVHVYSWNVSRFGSACACMTHAWKQI